MRKAGLCGMIRGKIIRTTVADALAPAARSAQAPIQSPATEPGVSAISLVSRPGALRLRGLYNQRHCPAHRRLARQLFGAR